MKTKGHWVIKTSAGGYWCGNATFDPQLRKAQVYHWKEKAEEHIEVLKKRKYLPADLEFEVVAILEPKELKDTKAEWKWVTEDDLYCSCCGFAALNDYRGNPSASTFCPHCGKYMINHEMEDEEDV
jgi:hypothetical protein